MITIPSLFTPQRGRVYIRSRPSLEATVVPRRTTELRLLDLGFLATFGEERPGVRGMKSTRRRRMRKCGLKRSID